MDTTTPGVPKKLCVYYDGTCRMCSSVMDKLNTSSRADAFQGVDATKEALPPGVSYDAAMKHIHVVDESGRRYVGAKAFLRILEEYPRWKWCARIGRLPVVKQILDIGYWLIARNRYWMFGRNEVS